VPTGSVVTSLSAYAEEVPTGSLVIKSILAYAEQVVILLFENVTFNTSTKICTQ
jgi:hypothetical protein